MNKILASLLMIGLVLGIAGAGTWAIFSDSAQTDGNTFTAGTLNVDIGAISTLPLVVSNMKPGDSATLTVVVNNVGSLPAIYTASVLTSGDLFAVQAPNDDGTDTPATAAITSGGSGTIAPSGSATVVVTVTLPSTAGNQYQGDSGVVTVSVSATSS